MGRRLLARLYAARDAADKAERERRMREAALKAQARCLQRCIRSHVRIW